MHMSDENEIPTHDRIVLLLLSIRGSVLALMFKRV